MIVLQTAKRWKNSWATAGKAGTGCGSTTRESSSWWRDASSLGFVGINAREESRQEKELWPKSCPAMLHLLKTILFSVRVPVLSQNMYCTWPGSSVMLSALIHPLLVHLVPHQRVVVDQPDLRDFGQLDGDVEGEGDDDLEDDDERPEGEEAGPKGFKLVEGEKAMKGSEGGERVEPKTTAGGAKKAKCEEYQDAPDHLQVDLPL